MIVFKGADAGPTREARIAKYAERAGKRMPLFDAGPVEPVDLRHYCWACNSRIVWGRTGLTPDRGVRRPFGTEAELYCRSCFDQWGWGLWHPQDNNGGEE